MVEPRAFTAEEARDALLTYLRHIAAYWAEQPHMAPLEKCEGLLFSILVTIDGGSIGLPSMDIVFRPHPDDKEYLKSQDENWYEDGLVVNADVQLHELLLKK